MFADGACGITDPTRCAQLPDAGRPQVRVSLIGYQAHLIRLEFIGKPTLNLFDHEHLHCLHYEAYRDIRPNWTTSIKADTERMAYAN